MKYNYRIKILTSHQISRSIQINPDKTNQAPPPSIWTVGKNGRRMYWSIERSSPWSIERSSAVGGRYPLGKNGRRMYNNPPPFGGGTPGGQIIGHDSLCHRFTATDEYERAYMVT
jgi:hypothetical protein